MTAVLLACAVVGGLLATLLYDDDAPLVSRLAAGVPVGLVLSGLGGLAVALPAGRITAAVVAAACLVPLLPALGLFRGPVRARLAGAAATSVAMARGVARHPTPWAVLLAVLAALAGWVLWTAFDRAMIVAPDGGIHTGVDHNLGDLPFHVAIVTGFLHGDNFPPEHPELAGARLTYPFLNDFLSAVLMKAGAPLRAAFFVPNVLLAFSLVALLFRWSAHLTRERAAAVIAPALVLLSGGFGFLLLGRDVDPTAGGFFGYLPHPTADYTIRGTGEVRWGNLVTTMLMTQRSLLLGLPLVLVVWLQWWRALGGGPGPARARLLAAGALTGLLPLAHAHAFAVTVAVGLLLAVLSRRPAGWARFAVPALVLGLPQVLWLASGDALQVRRFLDLHVGWDREASRGLAGFWLMNLGLFLPAYAAALLGGRWRGWLERDLFTWSLAFLPCFVVPNLLQLSPWIWDNIKFLVFWHVASAPLVALLVVRLWRRGWRAGSAAALFVLVFAGGLDVWRVVSGSIDHVIVDGPGVAFANRMRAVTPPRAVILHAPVYNSEVYLTGRRSVLGYPGHIWSQGLDGGTREEEIRAVYAGARADAVLRRYGVTHVLVGPLEAGLAADPEGLRARHRVIAESVRHRLHAVEAGPPR